VVKVCAFHFWDSFRSEYNFLLSHLRRVLRTRSLPVATLDHSQSKHGLETLGKSLFFLFMFMQTCTR
jgi:hypothetical protein